MKNGQISTVMCCESLLGAEKLLRYRLVRQKRCQGCSKEEDTEKHSLSYHCPCSFEIRSRIPSKKEWRWQRGNMTHPLGASQCDEAFEITSLRMGRFWESQEMECVRLVSRAVES